MKKIFRQHKNSHYPDRAWHWRTRLVFSRALSYIGFEIILLEGGNELFCDPSGSGIVAALCSFFMSAFSVIFDSPLLFCVCRSCNVSARRRSVRFSGFWRVRARLCPESRTNRRHGRDSLGSAFGCLPFSKTLNYDLTFTLNYGYNISVKVGDSYVF